MNIDLPKYYRILIIDDLVSRSSEDREFFRNAFTAIALQCAQEKGEKSLPVEVVFEENSREGVKRWQNEIFDLTLIDSDFSANLNSDLDSDFDQYVLSSRRQGFNILSLLHQSVHTKNGSFRHRKDMCELFLWSGLPWKFDDDPIIPKLFNEFSLDLGKYFVSKDPAWTHKDKKIGAFDLLKERVREGVARLFVQNGDGEPQESLTTLQKVERLLFALGRRDWFSELHVRLMGGGLIYDDQSHPGFPFLQSLGAVEETTDKFDLRICPGRIPPSVLDTWTQQNDGKPTAFLPFDEATVMLCGENRKAIFHTIEWIRNFPEVGSDNRLSSHCRELARRASRQQTLAHGLDSYPKPETTNKPRKPTTTPTLLGRSFKNRFLSAATPITGITTVGRDRAIAVLRDKVLALLRGPFGGAILKTTYLDSKDQWRNVYWPGLHIQSHMRTRCLYPETGTATLWNTGCTALEALPPDALNELLHELKDKLGENNHRVIVSLGSKFHKAGELRRGYEATARELMKGIWEDLFQQIYAGFEEDPSCFPFVEINVRHFLREILQHYVGGDEYLNPARLYEEGLSDLTGFWTEYRMWLQVIHEVGVRFDKKLILKFPYRSDTLALIRCAVSLRELQQQDTNGKSEVGISAVTLVNALKTPVPVSTCALRYTPAWYSIPSHWRDAHNKRGKYQMSGAQLAAYRNQILAGILPASKDLREHGLEVWLSGGITDRNQLSFCREAEARWDVGSANSMPVISGIQVGTWALLRTDLSEDDWVDMPPPTTPASSSEGIPEILDTRDCQGGCRDCAVVSACRQNVLSKESKKRIELTKEENCALCETWACIKACLLHRLKRMPLSSESFANGTGKVHEGITPRICFVDREACTACGNCQQTYYCDAFVDRAGLSLPPLHDPRACSGCGLCAQLCKSGALQMYDPGQILILISSSQQRQQVLRREGVPFLAYDPVEDLENIEVLKRSFIVSHTAMQQLDAIIVEDILDWSALCQNLEQDRNREKPNPGKRIWGLLSSETKALLWNQATGIALSGGDKTSITIALNSLLARRDFFRDRDYSSIDLPEEVKKLLARDRNDLAIEEIQRLNRLLIQTAYPNKIAKGRLDEFVHQELKGPSLFIVEDILDWSALCSKLEQDRNQEKSNPGKRIWGLLPSEIQTLIRNQATDIALSGEDKTSITIALNSLFAMGDFFRDRDYSKTDLPEEVKKLLARDRNDLTIEEIQRLNRLLIQTAYPNEIAKVWVLTLRQGSQLDRERIVRLLGKASTITEIMKKCCTGGQKWSLQNLRQKLSRIVEAVWLVRVSSIEGREQDFYALRKGKEKLYPENREERRKICLSTANALIAQLKPKTTTIEQRIATARAVVWSQLIWTDPGQILWDSPLMIAQTCLERKIKAGYSRIPAGSNFTAESYGKLLDKTLRVKTWLIVLHRGQVLLDTMDTSDAFASQDFDLEPLDEGMANRYGESLLGTHRLAGLDVWSCGEALFGDQFRKMDREDIYAIAGLPIGHLRQELDDRSKLPPDETNTRDLNAEADSPSWFIDADGNPSKFSDAVRIKSTCPADLRNEPA
jgi:Pyruvate/2-oxoacid:ferredoxin oxidoreductase delta subunit/predicted house-cleaning NTP pyrophosphatase (Maf/HAM1 superfamily)